MEPDAGEFAFDFLGGGGGVVELDAEALELAGLADGGGGEAVFFLKAHAFPYGSLGSHGKGSRLGDTREEGEKRD
jgi:hypothetical protein